MARERSKLSRALGWMAAGTAAIALVQEMRKPKPEREWHGKVGFIPYDFRLPTPGRLRQTFWNPDDDRILMPRAFGIGWDLNFGRVVKLIRS